MAKVQVYGPQAMRRINRAVRKVERLHGGTRPPARRAPSPLQLTFLQLIEDIEHGEIGKARLAGGPSIDATIGLLDLDTTERDVFNPGPKRWQNSIAICQFLSLADADVGNAQNWVITQCWSATRIRGEATTDITPSTTGTLSGVISMDGLWTGSTAEVWMPTNYVTAKQGVQVWAELVYREATRTSRWEIYSADCTGASE